MKKKWNVFYIAETSYLASHPAQVFSEIIRHENGFNRIKGYAATFLKTPQTNKRELRTVNQITH